MEYLNEEQDIVKQTFNRGNYTSLKNSIPIEIAPDQILITKRQRIEFNKWNLFSQPKNPSEYMVSKGLFSWFEYSPAPNEYE